MAKSIEDFTTLSHGSRSERTRELVVALNKRLGARHLTDRKILRVPKSGRMVLTNEILESVITALWALGCDQDTWEWVRLNKKVGPSAQMCIRYPDTAAAAKMRNPDLGDRRVAHMLNERKKRAKTVSPPLAPILSSAWGFHPPVHDGTDIICEASDELWAMCDGVIIDARSSGWWGKGARASGGHSVSDGDGIIQLEVGVDIGPFKKGMHIGYGHAEHASVRVGQRVKAGQKIGRAGFANAWHIHLMLNNGETNKGKGSRDPMPLVRYALGRG